MQGERNLILEEQRQEAERLDREERLRWAQAAEEAARGQEEALRRHQEERDRQLAEATQEAEVQAMMQEGPPPGLALAETQGQSLAVEGDTEVDYGGEEEEVQGGGPSTDAGPGDLEEGAVGQLICASPLVK